MNSSVNRLNAERTSEGNSATFTVLEFDQNFFKSRLANVPGTVSRGDGRVSRSIRDDLIPDHAKRDSSTGFEFNSIKEFSAGT